MTSLAAKSVDLGSSVDLIIILFDLLAAAYAILPEEDNYQILSGERGMLRNPK
jgi:hypothetical protein